MKILHLVTKRQYRGAEVFASNLSEELIKLGHEIIFAGLYENHKTVLTVPNALNLDLLSEDAGSFSPKLVRRIVKLVKNTKPDIIQCNGSDTLKYMVAASYFLPKIPILYRNISMISKWFGGESHRMVYQYFLRKVDHVSSVGNMAVEDFIQTCNYPREKTSVIRRGIPVMEIDGEKSRKELNSLLGLTNEHKIVIHIGNFSPEKNHIFLLDVFAKIAIQHPHIKLVCVGDGALYKEIEKEIEKRGLSNTVFLLGFKKDISEMLAGIDCLVLSSKVEGVPGVILEAAAQKKPSVAINVGGVSEVLLNGKTGFFINNFDQEAFSSILIELLSDHKLCQRMGENAYNLVIGEYSPLLNAKKFETLYKQLVQKSIKL